MVGGIIKKIEGIMMIMYIMSVDRFSATSQRSTGQELTAERDHHLEARIKTLVIRVRASEEEERCAVAELQEDIREKLEDLENGRKEQARASVMIYSQSNPIFI